YIWILPGFGAVSEILPVFARKPIFGYKAVAAASVVIAFLGLLVWAHHMFATPSPTVVLVFFMMSSFLIAVPTGVKIFNWIATLWRGTIEFRTPMLFCCAFIANFLLGVLVTVFNVLRSLKRGVVAGPDPWKGNTLEWFTTSPPPQNNFDVVPRVRSVEPMKDIRREIDRRTGRTTSQAAPVPESLVRT